jgi:AraC-like DNA-binding protein
MSTEARRPRISSEPTPRCSEATCRPGLRTHHGRHRTLRSGAIQQAFPQPPWDFSAREPAPGAGRRWRDTARYAEETLASAQSAAPLVISSVSWLLAATALTVFPNTALAGLTIEDRRDAHPRALRRAVSFIDDNARADITITDIAAAAFVTPRAVQLAFRRHLGTTPMEYLRRVRLAHAHHDLLAADPEHTTVAAVAYRWGFPTPSRFGAYYRQAYGTPPSHTLGRR